ncbi:MAG: RNA methyltransferase [Urechidicola sp.]|nr:RNA methyltransferase [Urechidicola sp.]
MLSKSQSKLITSLYQKKYRNKHQLFIVEGIKAVNEFLNSDFNLHALFCTSDFTHRLSDEYVDIVSDAELKKISSLKNPNEVLALFQIPEIKPIDSSRFTLVLDGINDPGNLGTIIRLCDWFGVTQLVCSKDTVDCFNPKVVQATMGSLARVEIQYTDIIKFLSKVDLPIYTAMMDGENVYQKTLEKEAILVMGNEANGISDDVLKLITQKISIPRFGDLQQTESLNVATATAILLSEFKR